MERKGTSLVRAVKNRLNLIIDKYKGTRCKEAFPEKSRKKVGVQAWDSRCLCFNKIIDIEFSGAWGKTKSGEQPLVVTKLGGKEGYRGGNGLEEDRGGWWDTIKEGGGGGTTELREQFNRCISRGANRRLCRRKRKTSNGRVEKKKNRRSCVILSVF